MEWNEHNEFVICPYDPLHRVLKSRLPKHLLRCSKNHEDSKMVICPFDTSHVVKEDELATHTSHCKTRAKHLDKEKTKPIAPATPRPILEDTEDWDNDPPVPAYNPEHYCSNNLIIRHLQGAPPAARRQFRESERIRLLELVEKENSKKN